MKKLKLIILAAIAIAVSSFAYASFNNSARCTGASNCKACKTCEYCKHCSKDGGTCGVCKKK